VPGLGDHPRPAATAAYLAGDHVGCGTASGPHPPLAEELAADEAERKAWLDNLRRRDLLNCYAGEEETVQALHRYLTRTPSRLLCVALTDAVGDRLAQNQPGTTNEYPQLAGAAERPRRRAMTLEDVLASPRARPRWRTSSARADVRGRRSARPQRIRARRARAQPAHLTLRRGVSADPPRRTRAPHSRHAAGEPDVA
jgi:hypothetical protein